MTPRRWLVLTIEAPSAESAALLAGGLFVFGVQAVEERANAIVSWLAEPSESVDAFLRRVTDHLADITGAAPVLTWEWRADQDWAEEWKRGLAPRRVGRRLIVAPSWTSPEAGPDDIVITIDPQMAFGTGEHASTRGALRLLEPIVRPGMRALDVGTGSAVLAIAAARLGATDVLGIEVDEDALINARENVDANRVAPAVTLVQRRADAEYIATLGHFDLIIANILSSVISPLLPAFHTSLSAGGAFVVAGILEAEAADFSTTAAAAGFVVEAEDREGEWWSARLRARLASLIDR